MMMGAIRAVLTPYSIAIAKGMAPAGPAAFNTNSLFQSAGQFPAINKPTTSTGRPNNFMQVSRHMVRDVVYMMDITEE